MSNRPLVQPLGIHVGGGWYIIPIISIPTMLLVGFVGFLVFAAVCLLLYAFFSWLGLSWWKAGICTFLLATSPATYVLTQKAYYDVVTRPQMDNLAKLENKYTNLCEKRSRRGFVF